LTCWARNLACPRQVDNRETRFGWQWPYSRKKDALYTRRLANLVGLVSRNAKHSGSSVYVLNSPTREEQPARCMQPQYTDDMERGSTSTSEAEPPVLRKAMEPLPPAFFDDLPLQYTDNAHRRRHLPYGVHLQPPLRDPLKEPVATLSGDGSQRVNGVFTFPAVGPTMAWDCNFLSNVLSNGRLTQQHCCVRTFGYYEICKHRSLQKKHMQVEPYREIDENNHDLLSYTSLISKESMLQPRCLQKRCDKYLELEREARIEGMCSKCKASGLTEDEIREQAHQESMEHLKKTLERFRQGTGRHIQGSNKQPPDIDSVKDVENANGQLKSRGDKDQMFARNLGHRRQRSIFVSPCPCSPKSGPQNPVNNVLQSFNPSLKQRWGPEISTTERDGLTGPSLGGWAIPAPRGSGESHKTTEKFSNSADSMVRLKLKPGSNQYEVMSNASETIHGEYLPKLKLKIRKPPSSTYES